MSDQPPTREEQQAEWDALATERETGVAAPEETTPVTPSGQQAASAPAVAADPYEGLPAEAKAKLQRFDQLEQLAHKQGTQLNEFAGRVSALQSEFARSRQATPAGQAPNATQLAAAAKDPDKWEALKKDFPEWGDGIEAFVDHRMNRLGAAGMTPDQVEQLVASRLGDANAAMAQQRSELQHALVDIRHPDWRQTVNSDGFRAWSMAQTPEVQALLSSPNAADAVRMLTLYDQAKAKPAAEVRGQRNAALKAAVTTAPGATARVKTFEDMSPNEQWNYLAEERARSQR